MSAHHEEVDGKDGERLYPPDVLHRWKTEHEGDQGSVLNSLRIVDTEILMEVLVKLAEPPLSRLERITKQLEETGTATAGTVQELKAIIAALSGSGDLGGGTVRGMARLASVLEDTRFGMTANRLSEALEQHFPRHVTRMEEALMRMRRFEQ